MLLVQRSSAHAKTCWYWQSAPWLDIHTPSSGTEWVWWLGGFGAPWTLCRCSIQTRTCNFLPLAGPSFWWAWEQLTLWILIQLESRSADRVGKLRLRGGIGIVPWNPTFHSSLFDFSVNHPVKAQWNKQTKDIETPDSNSVEQWGLVKLTSCSQSCEGNILLGVPFSGSPPCNFLRANNPYLSYYLRLHWIFTLYHLWGQCCVLR